MAISFASFSFSQDSENQIDVKNRAAAIIDANYCLALDDATPLQEYYIADASSLGWTSAAHAKKMCGFHSNNLVWYTPDFENGKMYVHIYVDRTFEPKDFAWWNDYLLSICK